MDLEKINAYKEERKRQEEQAKKERLEKENTERVAKAVELGTKRRSLELNVPQKAKLVDPVASPDDIKGVVDALNDIIVSQTVTNDDLAESFKDIAGGMLAVADEIAGLPKEYDNKDVVSSIKSLVTTIKELPKQEQQNLKEVVAGLKDVSSKISSLKLDPKIDVEAPNVDVQIPEIDVQPLVDAIDKIKVEVPETVVNVDTEPLLKAMVGVGKAINSLEFPIPNYVLPFKDVDGKGTQVTLGATGGQAIQAADSPSIDAFARWRTSDPFTLFDSKQLHDSQPLFWDDQEVSGGSTTSSHSTAKASTTIGVALNTAGKRVRQTFQRFNYQPGKSQLVFLTGTLGATGGGTGITRAAGIFDDDNGIFMKDDEGTLKAVIRSSTSGSPVDTEVAQSSWNLDKLDGTGASGITIDPDQSQIIIIDFEWLGVGRVRVGFVFDGIPVYVHQFLNANNSAGVYMSTPNLPLRYEIENDGAGVASTLEHICSSVISEGGVDDTGILRATSTGGTHIDANAANSVYACIGLRLKTTHLDAVIKEVSMSMISETNDDFEWLLYLNPTVAGTFTYSDETSSAIQSAKGATANTVTSGTLINSGFAKTNASVSNILPNALHIGSAIDGTRDTLVLAVRPLAANADIQASITWRELS